MSEFNSSKRLREEANDILEAETKKHKSFNHILSILDEEEDEPTQDLSSLITTLQQELSSQDPLCLGPNTHQEDVTSVELTATVGDHASSSSSSSSYSFLKEDEDDDKESVIRHLLEASDDELGIPNRQEAVNGAGDDKDGIFNGGDEAFPLFCDGLWEFEDVNANYYALLQSELFM